MKLNATQKAHSFFMKIKRQINYYDLIDSKVKKGKPDDMDKKIWDIYVKWTLKEKARIKEEVLKESGK